MRETSELPTASLRASIVTRHSRTHPCHSCTHPRHSHPVYVIPAKAGIHPAASTLPKRRPSSRRRRKSTQCDGAQRSTTKTRARPRTRARGNGIPLDFSRHGLPPAARSGLDSTSFPHPPTSFPHSPTSFPHPPTSFPHSPTSFPRRRESPVAPGSQRSRRTARSCRPPAVMPRDRTEPATAVPMLRGDSRPRVDHRGCDVEECGRVELRANCSPQGMKSVQDMIYCLDFSKKQRSALRRTTSPIRTDDRGWSQQE